MPTADRVPQGESRSAAGLVEHFFRHESANLVAVLSRAFGVNRLDLIEDQVQAAMLEAMDAWKHRGVPDNPAGWIHRVARNRILDAIRREKVHQRAASHAGQSIEATESLVSQWLEEDQLPDSLLRMMFVCCHPSLDRSSQIALTLKVLCGFGITEIARGLLTNPETIKKRIQRAKKKLAEQNVGVELPQNAELQERLSVVHDALYLLFNEGYSTSHGHDPIRDDLCEEAARLCLLLCENQIGTPETFALLALFLFQGSRLDSRVDKTGAVVLLEDQDRSLWDRRLIGVGESWLRKSGSPTSRFHLEAGIALLHCRAASVVETNWAAIVTLYNRLLQLMPSPIYRLNRAIAVAQAGDMDAATNELLDLKEEASLSDYFLLDCAQARVSELSGDVHAAIDCYLKAISRGVAPHERTLIEKKIAALTTGSDAIAKRQTQPRQ
ncbi:MAG: RNA polymerase sigma factor [Planctomycetaceae bacterium]